MKMMNTIRLPGINSNILALTSLILIFAMMFLTVQPALAEHDCDDEKAEMDRTRLLYEIAYIAYFLAEQALELAKATGIDWLIEEAKDILRDAAQFLVDATVDWQNARDAYIKCRQTKHASAGCDSGLCGYA